MTTDPLVIITSLGGSTPVQGEGTLPDGPAFYFRARYEAWTFSAGATLDEAIDGNGWSWSEPFGDQIAASGRVGPSASPSAIPRRSLASRRPPRRSLRGAANAGSG